LAALYRPRAGWGWWLGQFAGGWVDSLVAGSIASPAGGVRGRIACPVQPCEWLAAGWTVGRANGLGYSRLAIRARPPPSRAQVGVAQAGGW